MSSPEPTAHQARGKYVVVNPYLRKRADQPFQDQFTQQKPNILMGLDSRQRVGSIKASKRFGSGRSKKFPKKKTLLLRKNRLGASGSCPDGTHFNPSRHCMVCRAVSLGCAKPHRAHHERCYRNKATKGRIPEENLQLIMGHHPSEHSKSSTPSMLQTPLPGTHIGHALKLSEDVLTQPASHTPTSSQKTFTKAHQEERNKNSSPQGEPSLGACLRNVLQGQYASLANATSDVNKKLANLLSNSNKSLPTPIVLLFSYITESTQVSRRSKHTTSCSDNAVSLRYTETLSQRYKYFPPGTCVFTFPADPSLHPFPPYHSIEGMSVFSLDWESMFPGIVLPTCMEMGCHGELSRDRTNFSKNKTLFPVFLPGGLPMWGSVMVYKCGSCQASFNANDGRFLSKLDDHIACAYPVEPRYALGNYRFHLSIDVTEDLESTMLTNGSGDSFSKKMHRSQCNKYKRVIKTYASKAIISRRNGGVPDEWTLLFEEWNGKFVPSGSQLRSYYLDGEKSPLTPYGYSHLERYRRELQQVGRNIVYKAAAIDWTFQVLKTYVSLPGAKACFTLKVSDGQMAGMAIVRSTAVAEISHFLIQLVTKRCMKVQVLYTDLWPSSENFWKNIFGPSMVGRLGLFHAIKRITDTFRKGVDSDFFQDGMNDLKKCFYSHDTEDLGNLYSALKNGSMSQQNYKYSDKDVQGLERSRYWSQRYGKYLKKNTHPSSFIEQKLLGFITNWRNAKDDKSRNLFTNDTENTICQQLKNIAHVSDPPGMQMYREVKAGPSSKHGLSEWHSLRMESQLEKGHHLMAHYGNTGMGTSLADSLIMRGITETNTKVRYKAMKKKAGIPSHLEDIPFYWDSSELSYINQKMKQASLQPVFHGVANLPPDNGEVFLSDYLYEQNERNKSMSLDPTNHKCTCPACQRFLFPLLVTTERDVNQTALPPKEQVKPDCVDMVQPRPAPGVVQQHPRNHSSARTQPKVCNEQELAPIVQYPMQSIAPLPKPATISQPMNAAPPITMCVSRHTKTSPIHAFANHPYFVSANFFCHQPHFLSPPQYCCPYPPYYCPSRLAWICQGGRSYLPDPPPHNRGCPGWRPRGAVASPFLHMNKDK